MFEINPNAIYLANDLADLTGFSKPTIYKWFKDGLKHYNGAGGMAATGRALLDFFETQVENEAVSESDKEQKLPPKVLMRMKKAGVY